ncbi:MAG TPA: Gfo/Idh/MocA family oxidoreductase [Capsulimonadaceae bacterium]|jgi:predicted dehydrogenase
MSKVRYGIIGCGVIHHSHVEALEKLADVAELVAVCDHDPVPLAAAVERCGVPGYADLRELVALPNVDAVIVCTPSGYHGDHAIAALDAGKHVITEKPIEISMAKTNLMIAAAERNSRTLSCISQTRYGAGIRQMHAWMDEGKLGKIVYGEVLIKRYRTQAYYDSAGWRGTWEVDGGGALMNQGVHYVDQLVWAMGKPKTVYARMGTLAHERIAVEDMVTATIEFESGALGTLMATTCAYPGLEATIDLHGTEGSVCVGDEKLKRARFTNGEVYGPETDAPPTTVGADPRTGAISDHWRQLNDFSRALLDGRPPEITAADGRAALALVLAVYESARTGEVVRV